MARDLLVEPINLPESLSVPDHFRYALGHVTAPAQVPMKSGSKLGGFFGLVPNVVTETRSQTPYEIRLSINQIVSELEQMDKDLKTERFHFQDLATQQAPRRAYLNSSLQHYQMADYGFPLQMDMSFLQKCWPGTSMPIFGVLTLYDSIFAISCSKSWGEKRTPVFTPELPTGLAKHYSVPTQYLYSLISNTREGTASVSAKYSGSMPKKLEDYIQIVVNSEFFKNIWVIFQLPEELELNVVVEVSKDPIIVGEFHMPDIFPGLPPTYYFLGMFDPKPWERIVAETHTSRI